MSELSNFPSEASFISGTTSSTFHAAWYTKKKNRKKANCHQTCTTVPLNHKTKETTVQEFYFLIKYLKKKKTNKQTKTNYLPKSNSCSWITESSCSSVMIHKVRNAFICVSHLPATGKRWVWANHANKQMSTLNYGNKLWKKIINCENLDEFSKKFLKNMH